MWSLNAPQGQKAADKQEVEAGELRVRAFSCMRVRQSVTPPTLCCFLLTAGDPALVHAHKHTPVATPHRPHLTLSRGCFCLLRFPSVRVPLLAGRPTHRRPQQDLLRYCGVTGPCRTRLMFCFLLPWKACRACCQKKTARREVKFLLSSFSFFLFFLAVLGH